MQPCRTSPFGRAPRRRHHRPRHNRARSRSRLHAKGQQRLRHRDRHGGRSRHHRDRPPAATPITPSSPRKAAHRGDERSRLDHRSARRHHEFPARLSARSQCPSPARSRPPGARGGVRSMRQELFTASRGDGAQLDGRASASASRSPGRRADRHRLSVSRRTCTGSMNTWPCSRP